MFFRDYQTHYWCIHLNQTHTHTHTLKKNNDKNGLCYNTEWKVLTTKWINEWMWLNIINIDLLNTWLSTKRQLRTIYTHIHLYVYTYTLHTRVYCMCICICTHTHLMCLSEDSLKYLFGSFWLSLTGEYFSDLFIY